MGRRKDTVSRRRREGDGGERNEWRTANILYRCLGVGTASLPANGGTSLDTERGRRRSPTLSPPYPGPPVSTQRSLTDTFSDCLDLCQVTLVVSVRRVLGSSSPSELRFASKATIVSICRKPCVDYAISAKNKTVHAPADRRPLPISTKYAVSGRKNPEVFPHWTNGEDNCIE